MNVTDIISQANADLDEGYDPAQIMKWINRCLDDLTPVTKKQAKATFPLVADGSYTLPENFHDYAYVIADKQKLDGIPIDERSKMGYKEWDDTLTIQNGPTNGTLELYYYRKLDHVTTVNDVPEIETEFHDLFVLYVVGRMQFTEEDYDDRPDSMAEYKARKQEYVVYKSSRNRPGRVRLVTTYE